MDLIKSFPERSVAIQCLDFCKNGVLPLSKGQLTDAPQSREYLYHLLNNTHYCFPLKYMIVDSTINPEANWFYWLPKTYKNTFFFTNDYLELADEDPIYFLHFFYLFEYFNLVCCVLWYHFLAIIFLISILFYSYTIDGTRKQD